MDLFWKSSATEGFWAPVRSHGRCSCDGHQRTPLWPPADSEAGWSWHSHCLGGQEHTGCTRAGSPCSILHTRHLQHQGDRRSYGNHLPESMALWQGCPICYLDTIRILFASCICPQTRWINFLPQPSIRRGVPVLRALLFSDNWITGGRSQWTRDYSLMSLQSVTSTGIRNILALLTYQISSCKLLMSQRRQSGGKPPTYNHFKKILHFYCFPPCLLISCSMSQFTTLFQSSKLIIAVHNRISF